MADPKSIEDRCARFNRCCCFSNTIRLETRDAVDLVCESQSLGSRTCWRCVGDGAMAHHIDSGVSMVNCRWVLSDTGVGIGDVVRVVWCPCFLEVEDVCAMVKAM